MIRVSLQQLATVLNAQLIGEGIDIEDVSTDTRKLTSGGLFIALKGEKFDAHDYAADAVKGGAAALLVSKHLPINVPQLLERYASGAGPIGCLGSSAVNGACCRPDRLFRQNLG